MALAATGCGGDNTVRPEPEVPADKCVLMLSTGIIERSRAGETVSDTDKMQTLRVVIVRPDGTVEHNDFVDFGGLLTECVRIYEVIPNEKKIIYLIANEGGISGDISSKLTAFNPTEIENLVFSLGKGLIPMTSKYELTSPAAGRRLDKEMHVVRAATKISYRFVNYRGSKVKVNNIKVSSSADRMYLMPHVNEPDLFKTFDGERLPWIDWLKRVSDESQINLGYPTDVDPPLADKRGWITDYDIPDGTAHSVMTLPMDIMLPDDMGLDKPNSFVTPKPVVSPEFYMNESRFGVRSDGTQSYTMSFDLTEYKRTSMKYDENGKLVITYDTKGVPVVLDNNVIAFNNLKALFRNTHVLVDVEIKSEIFVKVIPYAECWLDPIFGLDPETSETTK